MLTIDCGGTNMKKGLTLTGLSIKRRVSSHRLGGKLRLFAIKPAGGGNTLFQRHPLVKVEKRAKLHTRTPIPIRASSFFLCHKNVRLGYTLCCRMVSDTIFEKHWKSWILFYPTSTTWNSMAGSHSYVSCQSLPSSQFNCFIYVGCWKIEIFLSATWLWEKRPGRYFLSSIFSLSRKE